MKNTLDWGKIKNGFSGFEKLALLYVKETFENSSWTATPATRDGNKDAVAIILGYQAGILEDQKWWMEAKYSNETVSLTRYRLDATIVSAILEKNVAKIIFITNLLLKPKTIADLQNALKLATGYDDIRFVCKYDLEYWLFRKRQYMQDFFEPENCIFDLPELFIVNKAEYYYSSTDILAFKESLQFLQKDIPYRMYFSVYSSVKKNCKIISNSTFSGIKILSDRNIHLYPGENRITVDFKLSGKFPGKRKKIYNSDPLFNIEGQPVISEKFITVSENAGEYVVLEYQERILKDLEKFLKKFHEENIFKIYEIIGNSGSGKSFIANNFLQLKDCRKTGVYYFEFSNSSADNMIALVNLIIYIHFPYLAADDVDIDYINTLNHENYISVCLKKLIENRSDFEELNKTIFFYVTIDKDNNRTVACNGVVIHQMVPSAFFLNGKKAYITSVYTDEDYRCMGIQNVLMKMIFDFLEEIECKKIELDAVNPNAIKLYEKFGFKKDDEKYILDIK